MKPDRQTRTLKAIDFRSDGQFVLQGYRSYDEHVRVLAVLWMGFRPASSNTTTPWTVGEGDNVTLMTHENELVGQRKRNNAREIIKIICLFKRAEGNVKIEKHWKNVKLRPRWAMWGCHKIERGWCRDGEKIANRKLCVLKDLCHLLQFLLSKEMAKSEERMEGCGSLRNRKAEIRRILIVQGWNRKKEKQSGRECTLK